MLTCALKLLIQAVWQCDNLIICFRTEWCVAFSFGGIVGLYCLLSFHKRWSIVPNAKGDMKGSFETPYLSI